MPKSKNEEVPKESIFKNPEEQLQSILFHQSQYIAILQDMITNQSSIIQKYQAALLAVFAPFNIQENNESES